MKCVKCFNFYIILLLPVIIATKEYNTKKDAPKLDALSPELVDFYPAIDDDFSSYTTIYPKIVHIQKHQRTSRSLDDNEHKQQQNTMILSFQLNDQLIYADLELKNDFLPTTHRVHLQDPSEPMRYITQNFTKTDMKLCHYQGTIRHKSKSSRVVLSTCSDNINGIVIIDNEIFYIHAADATSIHDKHLLIRQRDLIKPKVESYENTSEYQSKLIKAKAQSKHKRSASDPHEPFNEPNDANDDSSYIEFAIFVDYAMFDHYNRDVQKIHSYCLDLTHLISAYYETLNIFVVLVDVVIWNRMDPIQIVPVAEQTLNNFLVYRKGLLNQIPNDNAQLLSRKRFEGIPGISFANKTIGRAYLGTICTTGKSGGACMDSSSVLAQVAATMAHEMGHNFGLSHDELMPECQNLEERYLMSGILSQKTPSSWSPCSIKHLKNALRLKMNYCMLNKPQRVFGTPICGNGIVERGEQCDCGTSKNCNRKCCNPETCQLYKGFECAAGKCCELETCNFKTAGIQCRDAHNECDIPEFCTGESRTCPMDTFKQDLQPCDNNQAFCLHGQCKSHRLGCQFVWGSSAQSKFPQCYEQNKIGDLHGNCGYDRLTDKFTRCKDDHKLCGTLQCQPAGGFEAQPIIASSSNNMALYHYEWHNNDMIKCHHTSIDFGVNSDMDDVNMVGNGAKCGEQKMCYKQQCVPLEQLRAEGFGQSCPNNCSGNGFCNNLGHCHCDVGFSGESCSLPGAGGSIDSGPATDPNPESIFKRFVVIFGALILFAIISTLAVIIYHHRRHFSLCLSGAIKKKSSDNQQRDADGYTNPMLPQTTAVNVDALQTAATNDTEDFTSTSHANLLEEASPNTLQPIAIESHYSISVLDLTQKNLPKTTLKTLPRTLNLSQHSLRKFNNNNLATRSNTNLNEDLARRIQSLKPVVGPASTKQRNLKITNPQLQSTTNEKVFRLINEKTKSCENLGGN